MQDQQIGTRSTVSLWCRTLGVLLLGFLIGRIGDWPAESHAQPARNSDAKAPKAFLSGSERSVVVLKEISTTLTQIDKRVANIEKQLSQMEKK